MGSCQVIRPPTRDKEKLSNGVGATFFWSEVLFYLKIAGSLNGDYCWYKLTKPSINETDIEALIDVSQIVHHASCQPSVLLVPFCLTHLRARPSLGERNGGEAGRETHGETNGGWPLIRRIYVLILWPLVRGSGASV